MQDKLIDAQLRARRRFIAVVVCVYNGSMQRPAIAVVIILATFSCAHAQSRPVGDATIAASEKAVRFSDTNVVVYHSASDSGLYVGSPGLCVLKDGTYLAKMDEFGPKSTERTLAITRIFRSRDRGETWEPIARIEGMYWASITQHADAVFLIGTNKEYGDLVVRKSLDGGATWTISKDAKSGLIRPGQWHTAPVPVIEQGGRLWRSVEFAQGAGWGERFRPSVMSIPVDGDLLDAEAWTLADPMPRDGNWLGGRFNVMLEGNLVVAPDGRIVNVLRTDKDNLAAVAIVTTDARSLSIDPAFDETPMLGTNKKFQIRRDDTANCYWALCNPLPNDFDGTDSGGTRNVLALLRSVDLKSWEQRAVLLSHPDQHRHAFQYVDWIVDGDDLIVLSRTAGDDSTGGAHRAHDANFLTFHRFKQFRRLATANNPLPPSQ